MEWVGYIFLGIIIAALAIFFALLIAQLFVLLKKNNKGN